MVTQKAIPISGPQAPPDKLRSFSARWKHPELFVRGYVPVPLLFFEHYAQLKPFCLTTGEAMFVLHLMQFKWDSEAPFPGYKRIAAQMGISHKMARAHAKSLETKGLLIREMRVSQTNRFDLTPFFDALHKAAAKAKKPSRAPRPVQRQANRKAG
jgi:DNA-binding MarR family transcriptional regulator